MFRFRDDWPRRSRGPAFRVERAVRRLDALQTLDGVGDGAPHSEIIGLPLEHQPVAAGGKYEVAILRPDDEHLRVLARRRHPEIIRVAADGPTILHARGTGLAGWSERHGARDSR